MVDEARDQALVSRTSFGLRFLDEFAYFFSREAHFFDGPPDRSRYLFKGHLGQFLHDYDVTYGDHKQLLSLTYLHSPPNRLRNHNLATA